MLIQCTKTLLDKLGLSKESLKPAEGSETLPESLMAWHANYITLDRRKAIILMNNETRYPVVIYRPKPKDFKRINALIIQAIRTALSMEGVCKEVIDNYMPAEGVLEFSRTAGRGLVAQMNNSVNEIAFMWDYLDEKTLIQRYVSLVAGRLIQKSKSGGYYYPADRMLECLGIYSGGRPTANPDDVRELNLYQLKIEIKMEGYEIWRKVLVPSTYSFRHLHEIIQTVFDWQNYHLHRFEAKKSGAKNKQIVMDDNPDTFEWLDFDLDDVFQERFVALEDIFPEHAEVIYEYDFGDSWIHKITLEKVIKSNSFRATLLARKGERPPEDVGGSGGYHEYKRVMANPDDPEYESMKIWSESQKERDFSTEQINDRLKRVMSGYGYYYN
ncbi:MAG: plasmid pRiA4b ORF-3 family protein [Bacillota bacterium]|nr:plasmid pRiA4b ORF-3 family protein [Bacillota bacterium]